MQTQNLTLIKNVIKNIAANKNLQTKLAELEKDPDFSALLDIVNTALHKTDRQLKSLHKELQKTFSDNEKKRSILRKKYAKQFKNIKLCF